MSNSEVKEHGKIAVRSKFGPLRIELIDHQLNRTALGFGALEAQVPPGLYTLQYSAGTERNEEMLRVTPGGKVSREIDLPFPTAAPISVSTTAHEFHTGPAQQLSQNLKLAYGAGGGLMIFVRTIDVDGRRPVPIERLALLNADLQPVGDLAVDAERNDADGWACLSAEAHPGGYVLRWQSQASISKSWRRGFGAYSVDQALWVSAGWMTMVFIGYCSQADQLERQSASIYMARLGDGFHPGPEMGLIRDNRADDWEVHEARINQGLDLALAGLRTGNQVVPDDLLDLLLHGKFQNPMLGVVGAHAILQRQPRTWKLFDIVVGNLGHLIPDHPDVAALRAWGRHLRGKAVDGGIDAQSWPPMLRTGYVGLIESDWQEAGKLIEDDCVAARAAPALLPESPWTCWETLEEHLQQAVAPGPFGMPDQTDAIHKAFRAIKLGHAAYRVIKGKAPISELTMNLPKESQLTIRRIFRYLDSLREMGEGIDWSNLAVDDFKQLGLPISSVEKVIDVIKDVLKHEDDVSIGRDEESTDEP